MPAACRLTEVIHKGHNRFRSGLPKGTRSIAVS